MEDFLPAIRSEIRAAWRFRWWGMLTAWTVGLLGFVGLSFWPDSYDAQAVVFVDVSSRLDEVIGGVAIEWNIQEQVDRVRREMLSRPVLEAVARETDLDLRVTTPQEMSGLLGTLQQKISITESQRRGADPRRPTDTVLTISYSDADRDAALSVVQSLLNTFRRDVIRGGQGASEVAHSFLTERIASYQQMLSEREQALAQFKRENVGLLPNDPSTSSGGGDYFTRLQTSMEQLQELELELRAAVNRREALRAQLSSENPVLPLGATTQQNTVALPVSAGSDTQTRIAELEGALAGMLLRFTDNHPDVIATRQQLALLNAQRESELEVLAAAGGSEFEGSALSSSPVYQSIQIALNEVKVEIAALESRIDDHRARVADLREKVDVMPEVEARLAGLMRDYDQVKSVHDDLVQRLQQEQLGTAAVRDDVNFSVIQPPVADFEPATPNRMLILLGLFFVSLAAGGGVAYAMNMARPVFARARALQDFAQLPVLGTISAMHGDAQGSLVKRQVFAFVASMAIFTVVFAVLIALRQEAAVFARSLLA